MHPRGSVHDAADAHFTHTGDSVASGFARARRPIAVVRIRVRLAPAVHLLPRSSIARSASPIHSAATPPSRRAARCAAARPLTQSSQRFASLPADDGLAWPPPGDAADDHFGAQCRFRVCFFGRRFATGAFRSNLRCAPISAAIPSPLRLADARCASLARTVRSRSPPCCLRQQLGTRHRHSAPQFHRRSRSRWKSCAPS